MVNKVDHKMHIQLERHPGEHTHPPTPSGSL